ncbi:uncharacterized protein EKO05_0010328 [Ascochyta rabiei]|nr:uncharacterized protein EKO05_0010328 [Ascochyta rabiei]UPX20083.1 hypothetical protein EKO05_0010328 [Ascochyta rabiei]
MLMDSVISIKYGDELQDSCGIHEGMVCCHSQQVQLWCTRAKPLRIKYDKCEELAQELTSLSILSLTAARYEENEVEKKAASLITYIDNHFPLSIYQANVSKLIKDTLIAQVTDGLVKDPKTRINSKTHNELSFHGRLISLNWQGMLNMFERLCGIMNRIKISEKEKGKKDQIKAMAQKTIFLRGTSNAAVQSLLVWIYQGNLHYESSEHLYEVYELAIKLGVNALAEVCLCQLFNTASDIIHKTQRLGIALDTLLGFTSAEESEKLQDQHVVSDNTVEIIFQRVLKDEKPPARLLDLVVDVMAKRMHSRLWAHMQETISRPVALRLVETMLHLKDMKAVYVESPDSVIKLEDSHSANTPARSTLEAIDEPTLAS